MAGEWHEASLGELTDWASGGTPPKENPEYWGGDIPWISASSMKSGRLSESDRTLTLKGLEQRSKLARKNDVLLLVRGSELHKRIPVGVATQDVAFNQDVKALRAKNGISSTYLYYWLAAHESMLLSKVEHTGIGAGKLDTAVLKDLRVQVPPTEEQRAITHILGTLDDKIELNRRMNETLEAMARALFKDWFIDFGPVHAKMEGREPYLSNDIWVLFPGLCIESEFGQVPKGWKIETLGGHCSYLNRGISPKYVEEGGIFVINQKCIRDFAVDLSKARRHDHKQRKIDGRELSIGDVLVNSTGVGTLGRVAQVLSLPEPAIVDSHVTVVRAGTELTWAYLGLALMHMQPEIENMGEGSTGQTELSRSKLAELRIVVPPPEVLHAFDDLIVPLKRRISANVLETQTLVMLRNALLPRLISGELRLNQAEKLLERAA